MNWRTRFPVGLFLLAGLMLAGGVSAATSMRLVHSKAPVVTTSPVESPEPGEGDESETTPPESEPSPEPTEEPADEGDQGVRGGSVERFHEGCAFPDGIMAPDGNWTHGNYVSAWARTGDHEALQEAAHSPCGKPMHAVEKSGTKLGKLHKNEKHGKKGKGNATSR